MFIFYEIPIVIIVVLILALLGINIAPVLIIAGIITIILGIFGLIYPDDGLDTAIALGGIVVGIILLFSCCGKDTVNIASIASCII